MIGCSFGTPRKPFPDNKEILGRYFGPVADIGPTMVARILKRNGEGVVCSTLRSLQPDEILSEKGKEERARFYDAIYSRWGPSAKPGDFEEDLDIKTPSFKKYEDDETKPHTVLEADEHEDPDKYNKYLGAEVTLPRGNNMTAGRDLSCKRDHEGTPMG